MQGRQARIASVKGVDCNLGWRLERERTIHFQLVRATLDFGKNEQMQTRPFYFSNCA